MEGYDIPVTFIIFNRPDTTKLVFDKIRKIKPTKLYVISDGPRNSEEENLVKQTRSIIASVDWDCEVQTNYAEKNMECGLRIASGLDWVFEKEEYSIILEDDCVPDLSFFAFCRELLLEYKDDERMMYISGNNFHGNVNFTGSYDFVRIGWIWGWATWRRAWEKYDFEIKTWKQVKESNLLDGYYSKEEQAVFARNLDGLFADDYSVWDYQWQYTNAVNSGLCIVPCVNLVNNIGFDQNATHTKSTFSYYNGRTEEIGFPLKKPLVIVPNREYDRLTLIHVKGFEPSRIKRIWKRIKRIIKKILVMCGLYGKKS